MAHEPITILQNKRIVLGVTGSIAAYKVADLASKLTQAGALVDVIMTQAAREFVTPLTFEAVTGRAVYTDLWRSEGSSSLPTHIAHVGLGEGADLIAIIPATANTMAKLAFGMADDLLTVTALAARCPIMLAPAMDGAMYIHPATQANLKTLVERGTILVEPENGRFASGFSGKGRLPETPTLIGAIRHGLGHHGELAGRKIVITAGGTREAIDPVRYITNHSSGKQGYALAQAALDEGAQVVLISAAEHLPVPYGCELVAVSSAMDMLNAVLHHIQNADGLIMAAAVADFRPTATATRKIKKSEHDDEGLTLNLTRNADILLEVKAQREKLQVPLVVVGFAAESENLLTNAESKLQRKGLDLLVANDISATDAGFNVDTNRVVILDAFGDQITLPLLSKTRVAETIIGRVAAILNNQD